MKKIFILCCLTLFPTLVLWGQKERQIELTYAQNDFQLVTENGLTHIISSTYGLSHSADTLAPELPYVGVYILVAPNEEFLDATCNSVQSLFAENIMMACNTFPMLVGSENCFVPKVAASSDNSWGISSHCVEYAGTHMMDGYKYIGFRISPFSYTVNTHQLYLRPKITIHLKTRIVSPVKPIVEKIAGTGRNMRDAVKRLVANSDEMDILYGDASLNHTSSFRTNNSDLYDYLIITNDSLKPAFERLAHWKTIKGVRTKVVTINEVAIEYPSESLQISIKKAFEYYYLYKGLKYGLLGGDVNVIPPFESYVAEFAGTDGPIVPTDLFYACFDNNFVWNADNDSLSGEYPSDMIDMEPEIILSRISFNDVDELDSYVCRLIEYESNPETGGWTNNILMCGNKISTYGDSHTKALVTYNNSIAPYWDGSLFRLFDSYTDYPEGADYDVTNQSLQTEFEKGYTFIDVSTHGGNDVWGRLEDDSVYGTENADLLVNKGYSFIITYACFTNAFDRLDACLSETFIRNPKSGVLAYLGNTREGWSTTGPQYLRQFYKELFISDSKSMGTALTNTKRYYAYMNYNNYYRWTAMNLNLLGDAELPIYVSHPLAFSDVSVESNSSDLIVNAYVDGCTICVCSANDYGNSFYEVYENVSQMTLHNMPNDCYVCISKYGYIPYVARVGDDVFVQDEKFLQNVNIVSNITSIGNDVTPLKQEGPVVVEKGLLDIKSSSATIIENSFEVKKGGMLNINVRN